jgi:hypothetical protein
MSLRVHLSHSLGSRDAAFDDRGVDSPLIVGRGSRAHLQVPSVAVSSNHCVLFVHDGRWIVQDAGSRMGTFVNGQRISGPTIIEAGAVVSLGSPESQAATIRIEEASAGASTVAALDATYSGPAWHDDGFVPSPALTPVATSDYYSPDAEPTFPTSYNSRKRGRSKQDSSAMLVVALLMAIVFAIVAAVVIYQKRRVALAPEPEARVVQRPEEVTGSGRGSAMFSDPTPPSRPAQINPAPVNPAPSPRPATPTDPAPRDPSPDTPTTDTPDPAPTDPADPDWTRVEEAFRLSSPGEALAIFIDYQSRFPNSPRLPQVQRFIDDSLDRLWFVRMKQLADDRADLLKRRTSVQNHVREIQRSGAADRQRLAELNEQLKEFDDRITDINRELEGDMGYDGTAFDPYVPEQVDPLRAKRDAEKYDSWKRRVLGSVRRTRGALPW